MSSNKTSQRPAWPIQAPQPAQPDPVGRVQHDDRGNAVWSWSGRLATDSTTHLLRKLESPDLALADDQMGIGLPARDKGAGSDPYNQRDSQSPAVIRQLVGKR